MHIHIRIHMYMHISIHMYIHIHMHIGGPDAGAQPDGGREVLRHPGRDQAAKGGIRAIIQTSLDLVKTNWF